MEVILLERIQNLGDLGEMVKVKPGYARNFLLPQKKAMRATDDAKAEVEKRRRELAEHEAQRLDGAKARAELSVKQVTVTRLAGEEGKLFGSVTIQTRPAGCYPSNGFGLYDMCGNVREWCADDRLPYPGGPDEDWIYTQYGPFSEDEEPFYGKATRGGCWDDPNAVFVRINDRDGWDPNDSEYWLGFRCAKSVNP